MFNLLILLLPIMFHSPPGTPDDFLKYKKVGPDGKEIEVVRIFASFDMAWSQRSNGYLYDSLNGYACLIGMQTKKVVDFVSLNRKCEQCEIDEKLETVTEYDCRLNFWGSAKAMEPRAAVMLVVESKLLQETNTEVGVFSADNDSCSISAIQAAASHMIIKQSDMNHTKKGVGNLLYELRTKAAADPDHELDNDMIKHFKRCFSYAVHQNVGNLENMQAALKNIPSHAYGNHENCGSWCKASQENYVSTLIKNPELFKELKKIFDKLADNASKFLMAASTQINESLNNSMCSKSLKKRLHQRIIDLQQLLLKKIMQFYVACVCKQLKLIVNSLTRINKNLYKNGKQVDTLPKNIVMENF